MGDPVGSKEEAREILWKFRELSHRHDGWTVFYEVSPLYLPYYLDMGLKVVKIGEKARVPLESFSMEGHTFKRMRNMVNRIEKEGYRIFTICEFEGD